MLDGRFSVRLSSREELTEHITAFDLVDLEKRELPRYAAGAHIEVDVRPGLIRRYSLCGDPADSRTYRIAVLRDPRSRGGSATIHENWKPDEVITISTPRNNFALLSAPASIVLFAGGIGITPILSMAYELAQQERTFAVHYAARSQSLMAFHRVFAGGRFGQNINFYFDDGSPDERFDPVRILEASPKDAHIYVCGPAGFNAAMAKAALQAGFASRQFHLEAFSAPKPAEGEKEFTVELASTGRRVLVPADRTIVEALDGDGVFVPSMCRQGICGMCITNVLKGDVEHRDDFLTQDERARGNVFLPCCSRSAGGLLVLDI